MKLLFNSGIVKHSKGFLGMFGGSVKSMNMPLRKR
jgi:hypothetical protein